jgi:hypothetical protein
MKYASGEDQMSNVNNILQQPDIADIDALRTEWCKDLESGLIKNAALAIT